MIGWWTILDIWKQIKNGKKIPLMNNGYCSDKLAKILGFCSLIIFIVLLYFNFNY